MNILTLYIRDINKIQPLSPGEEEKLLALIKAGDESARSRFLEAHMKFIKNIAVGYINHKIPLCDLITHGTLGCIKAIKRYDPSKSKFTTYATYWIKQAIRDVMGMVGNDVHYGRKYLAHHNTLFMQQAMSFDELFYPPGEEPSEDTTDREINVVRVNQMLNGLSERYRKIIRSRYGIGCKKRTLRSIGEELNISHERVRQLQLEALEMLRAIEGGV